VATAGFKTRILLGDFSLSAKLASVSLPYTVDMLDVTTFADNGVKRFIPGLSGSTASASGFIDADTATDVAAWTTAQPLTYAPFGLAHGSRVELVDTLRATYTTGTQVAGVASFDLAATTDGFTDFGVSLHDLTAETADENGTSLDGSASSANGGVAQLHVTAFSGLTNAVITIEDSADDSSWATIATFATVTGLTSERVAVTGTVRRYLRYVLDVTGTGSVTFQTSFARR
jgi:hypothetical protein